MEFTNPSVAMEIVSILYYGSIRAANLVKKTIEATGVSEPTVYSVLNELQERNFIKKNIRSKRNVQYSLTNVGRKFLKNERFDAVEAMLSCVKSTQRRRELLMELLLEDMLEEIPKEIQSEELKENLRKSMKYELDDVRKRVKRYNANMNL